MKDPIYQAIGVSKELMETSSLLFLKEQVQKSRRSRWNGQWSSFLHKRDNRPDHHSGDFSDFVRHVGRSFRLTSKDGLAICPSVFIEGTTRGKDNVKESYLLGIDYDDIDEDAIREWCTCEEFPNTLALLYGSFRDGVVDENGDVMHRMRIFLPLSRPVNPDEFRVLIQWVFSTLRHAGFDTSCKDPSRLFFTLRTNPESTRHPWLFVRNGDPLDPDNLLGSGVSVSFLLEEERKKRIEEERKRAEKLWQKTIEKLEGVASEDEYLEHYARKALERAAHEVATTPEGGGKYNGRNNALNAEAYSMGQLVGAGVISEFEVISSLMNAALSCGLSEGEAQKTIESGLRKGESEPRDLTSVRMGYRERLERKKREKARKVMEESFAPSPFDEEEDSFEREEVFLLGDLHEKAESILSWLYAKNENPSMFLKGRDIVRVVQVSNADIWAEKDMKEIEVMDAKALRAHCMERARFMKIEKRTNRGAGEEIETSVAFTPPLAIFDHILGMDKLSLPPLEEIIRNPVADNKGNIIHLDGYHKSLKAWVDLGGIKVDVPDSPSEGDLKAAKSLILDELFHDFPFAEAASRVNALGLGILPYVRHLIKGATPMHLISAPVRGTGKSLLVSVISMIATGDYPETMTEGRDDEEWRKRITAALISSPSFIILDNINHKLDSGSLASVLTTSIWVDRLMGHSKVARLRNTAIWCATANNPSLSDELERRCLYIHLDPKTDSPENRGGFKHNPIQRWCMDNRQDLLTSFLTLVRYWAVRGMNKCYGKNLASFEQWASLMGGILEEIGEGEHFLSNRGLYRGRSDSEGMEWRMFCELWWNTFDDNPVYVKDLQELAEENEILETVLGPKNERSQRIRLGKALHSHIDRVFGDYRIQRADREHKVNAWKLTKINND